MIRAEIHQNPSGERPAGEILPVGFFCSMFVFFRVQVQVEKSKNKRDEADPQASSSIRVILASPQRDSKS